MGYTVRYVVLSEMVSSHNQSIIDASLGNHPSMLEKGSYVPWSSRFMRYIDKKKDYDEMLKDSIENGPYQMKTIMNQGNLTRTPHVPAFGRVQEEADLTAKRAVKTHDPLALVANHYVTPYSSPTSSAYYVTYPQFVADFDVKAQPNTGIIVGNSGNVDYGQQANGNNTNVQRILRTSATSGYTSTMLLAKKDEVGIDSNNKENDFLLADNPNEEVLEELNATCIMMEQLQSVNNDSKARPSYNLDFVNEVNDSQTIFIDYMFTKSDHEQCYPKRTKNIKPTYHDDQSDSNIIFDDPNVEGNSENNEQDNNVHDQKNVEFELLIKNVQLEGEKTNKISKTIKKENDLLKTKLEKYKARVHVFENKPENK
nr:hypothetical protein [Tanacetum cinerariifolium]